MDFIVRLAYVLLWPCAYLFIVLLGKRIQTLNSFRAALIKNWKPPLAIAVISLLAYFIGNLNPRCLLNMPTAIDIFCMASFGLALASGIKAFSPLPVSNGIILRDKPVKRTLLMLLFAVITVIAATFISSLGSSLVQALVHEKTNNSIMGALPGANKYLAFFTLLAGAGLAEGVPFRLFLLTLLWRVTKKPYLAIILSAVIFGLYHLTPIDSMYLYYWHYPITQFTSALIAGLIFGFVYVKRGFETSVLGHTVCDWVAVLLSN